MKNAPEVSMDEGTDAAWTRFRRRLADRLASLDNGDYVLVELEGDEEDDGRCTPYVQATSADGLYVVAEVSGNPYLIPQHRLDKASRRQLTRLGWARASKGSENRNYSVEFDVSRADEVAVMMVRALREVFGVVHPAFLVGAGIDLTDGGTPVSEAPEPAYDEPLAVVPDDRAELDGLVEQVLTRVLGQTPVRDQDGDIGVVSGSAVVFVRVLPDQPIIEIFAELVVAVTEPDRARFEVAVLNRDCKFAKFVLVDDMVKAHVHLPARPFAPEHLRYALAMMCEMADAVDDDLAFRVGGRTFLDSADA
jgi:hypothetical protein